MLRRGGPTSWCSLARWLARTHSHLHVFCSASSFTCLPLERSLAAALLSLSVYTLDLLPTLILSSRCGGRSLLSRTAALVHAPHRRRGHFLSNRPARQRVDVFCDRINYCIDEREPSFDRPRLPCRHPPGQGCAATPLWGSFFHDYCPCVYILIAVDGACNEPISAVWSMTLLCSEAGERAPLVYRKKLAFWRWKKHHAPQPVFRGCWQEKTNKCEGVKSQDRWGVRFAFLCLEKSSKPKFGFPSNVFMQPACFVISASNDSESFFIKICGVEKLNPLKKNWATDPTIIFIVGHK